MNGPFQTASILTAVATTLILCACGFAQEQIPLSKLPKSIETKDGQLGVFVDWDSGAENGAVDVFLVNRSSQPVRLSHAYGAAYVKLEAQNRPKSQK